MSLTLFRRIVVIAMVAAVLGSVALGIYQSIDARVGESNLEEWRSKLEDWSSELEDDISSLENRGGQIWRLMVRLGRFADWFLEATEE